jgi:ketosteroid isomerase-like protein
MRTFAAARKATLWAKCSEKMGLPRESWLATITRRRLPMPAIPPLIEAFRDATNSQDWPAFVALFDDDAVVNDWGSVYKGKAAIKGWSDREMIGAKGTLTVTRMISDQDGVISFDTDWKSSFFSGAGRFTVTVKDGKIAELRISEN